MGFDNECIVNIQSLAGEYFCPVCRLLVYPKEAMQSQCTHLYCKPCLTYVVSTTRACPYDGYLVTEADSKPLTESNKALAETIGKIPVHCLYHRSGCTWNGTLSECTSHCSGCVYGNSPVVCNRCGIQIVHRQVQEHAQSCPGVQSQPQQVAVTQEPSAASAVASTDQNQTAAPVGAVASQSLNSQTSVTTTTSGQDTSQVPNPTSQSQPVQNVQTAAPTAEQWYQQQQYQQYYQQYPGQDPYQQQYQHYYPYQQPVGPQYQQPYSQPQPQSQSQPQPQPQRQPQPQPQVQQAAQPQLQPQGISNPVPQVPAPVAPQPQNQMQVNQQQQLQPAVQPHGQIQPPSKPPGQSQSYPYPQVPHAAQPQSQPQQHMQIPPYQQPHPQAQHSQPQIQQPAQKYPVSQPQVHSQVHPNAPVQHLPQSQMHPHQSLTPNVQPQVQNASSNAVTGFQSYPQPQPQLHQSIQPGAPQHGMQMHAQSGPLPHAQHPVPTQNQFPHQIPVMHPHQTSAMFPNQQQPTLLPSPVQGQGTPPFQQQPVYNPNQQPGPINQRPTLQPAQQILAQQPFAQQHMPMTSHLRPQGPGHSFPRHSYPPSQGNPALLNSTQHSQSQNAVGRPSLPNHVIQMQPLAQSANNIPVRPGQTGASHLPENPNLLVGTNNRVQLSSDLQSRAPVPHERQGDVTEQHTNSGTGKLDKNSKDYKASGSENELKSEKVETDIKSIEADNKQNGGDQNSLKNSGPNVNSLENGNSVDKSIGKEEVAENNGNEHSAPKGNENQDGKMETKKESETDEMNNDDAHTSRPAADHVKQHQAMTDYGSAAVQQRFSAMIGSQVLRPAGPNDPLLSGHTSTFVRNHGPTHAPHLGQATMLKQPQGSGSQFGTPGQNFQPQSLVPAAPYNQGLEPPFHAGASNSSRIGGPQFGAQPSRDMHGGLTANLLVHAPDDFGFRDERFNSLPAPGHQNFDRREFEDDLRKFPRMPLDTEPVPRYGSRSFDPHESGKRPVGFHDEAIKKSGSTLHPGYLGIGPGHRRHHIDSMAPRSPGGEYPDLPPHRMRPLSGGLVGKPDIDDFDGRAARHFGEPAGIAFHDSRFPRFPGHMHRDEFEGFGNFRLGEHPRGGDFIGQDEFAGSFQRGEHFGPHDFSRQLHHGEPIVYGAHPGSRSFESFSKGNRPGHPPLGEPGFRSTFSLPGFPNDAGFLPGEARAFDNVRRKAASMGWCRICRVDCETVEGLDLHSQTREHQRTAMDIVKSIKQKVKKQKLILSEHSSVKDGNKTRNTGFEGRGNKH
ncbi:hypothetical protein PIB30_057313 [Stylosanthes scabra]|uniref:RING-type domain-containing protein n=1 Tax=Stylosanthes scabra TaxID=79078 RepID=A0ABU6QKD0_9FABA|nr:hypothetical protein [Stylosanthes scabra]